MGRSETSQMFGDVLHWNLYMMQIAGTDVLSMF